MAWARVDDGWWKHRKVVGLSKAARGVWVTVLSWSCAERSPHVPDDMLRFVMAGLDADDEAAELAAAGLWSRDGDGWVIHDWADYQDTTLSQKRAAAGRRGAEARWGTPAPPAPDGDVVEAVVVDDDPDADTDDGDVDVAEAANAADMAAGTETVADGLYDGKNGKTAVAIALPSMANGWHGRWQDPIPIPIPNPLKPTATPTARARARGPTPPWTAAVATGGNGALPTRAGDGATYAATLADWAATHGHDPPDSTHAADHYRWLVGLVEDRLERGRPRTRLVTRLCCDYVEHATGETLEPSAVQQITRVVAARMSGRHVVRLLAEAVDRGAGLDPEHRRPRAIVNYALAVERGEKRRAT